MADQQQGEINNEFNSANSGLNMDLTPSNVPKGSLTYALNANLENFDASGINYQNEPGNEFCLEFPKNFSLVGKHFIQERNKHIFMLANPVTGESEIGYMDNNDCVYRKLINANCLNFDINIPIHKIVHRITNCTTEIYWPDQNGRRFLDIDNIPYTLDINSDPCNPKFTDELDCNQINLQPRYAIPIIQVVGSRSGGNNTAGTVQFAFQYSDALGNGFTSYYSVTNPTPLADKNLITPNFNYPVGKSIVLNISNIETTGKFDFFNIAVIKKINDIASVELVGTFPISDSTKEIIYTGQSVSDIRLTINDIFEKFPVYNSADDVTAVSDVLVWKGLTTQERISYQKIANKITLQWETWRIPPGEDYSDEFNATNLRGYTRDEVYSFEFVPILATGKQCDGFHIPGRSLSAIELTYPDISSSDPDYVDDPDQLFAPYWKIYNTATNNGKSPGFSPAVDYKGPYEYGDFAYWESTREYPCDKEVWGDLAGKKIRHHKFPDVNISPIFESKIFGGVSNLEMGNTAIFPIGVKINVDQVIALIGQSDLTDEQKKDIVGFKIVRGNRGTNKSVVAKGILRNVNTYKREEQTFFFPNYPYNDLNDDVFLNKFNNAYLLDCQSFEVNIFKFNNADEVGEFTEVEYTDCNSGEIKKVKYRTLGTFHVCAVSKPALIGPGVKNKVYQTPSGPSYTSPSIFPPGENPNTFASKYDNYDVYLLNKVIPFGTWSVSINDAVAGNITINVVVPTYVHVKKGTIPASTSAAFFGYIILADKVVNNDCVSDAGVDGIKNNTDLARRQVFNSPETSFGQPFLGNILKLESVIYGKGRAHFVQVKDNAKYRLLTEEAQRDALKSSKQVGNITSPANAAAMFTVYQSYLTIYVNGIVKKNYGYSFNSRADYSYYTNVPNDEGVKQRRLDLKKYLIPVVQNVGEEDIDINNYQRETSVYLRTEMGTDPLPLPDKSPIFSNGPQFSEFSRFTIGCTEGGECVSGCSNPQEEKDIRVVSYYGSIKTYFPDQWGDIYSYETIDTGYQINLTKDDLVVNTIFGGDTFINRFAFKTKLPFFIDNRVGAPDESDIYYDELGNVAFPKFWHSSRSILRDFVVEGLGTLTNVISFKAHNFDCPNSQLPAPPQFNPNRTFYNGYFYLFAYGVPNFYVESSYNVDLRQAFNNREGDFWPHVSSGIPDDWFQESFVSIANDNTYSYNVTYSTQNKENLFTHLPADFSSSKKCFTAYPFRAIFSDRETANAENRVNNWLVYRATSYFDFPQNYGKLTSIDGIENRQLLARFENKSLLYNALYTNQTNTGGQVYLGQPLFSENTPPLDYAETDLGYVGSQHKFLLKIPYGQVSIDAKRGQIFLLNQTQAKDLCAPGSGMNRFFTDHLAFEILRFFPDINIDNHFKDLGLHGVYDTKYDRIIITKLDYIPIDSRVKFDSVLQEFYIDEILPTPDAPTTSTTTSISPSTTTSSTTSNSSTTTSSSTTKRIITQRIVVSLSDPAYFCNKSWTVSYSFITNSWISFHSYLPNWYIGENNFFYSGINTCCTDDIDFTFISGELVPNPSTTTTTSSFTTLTTTSTTTVVPLDCLLSGGTVTLKDCDLAGTAVITVPPSPPPCTVPPDVTQVVLVTGYDILVPPSNVVSTGSSTDACNAKDAILADPDNNIPTTITGLAIDLNIGSIVYNGINCNTVPDGWYIDMSSGDVLEIVGGAVFAYFVCPTSSTTTSTTTTPPTFIVKNEQNSGTVDNVTPGFYTLNPGDTFPVNSSSQINGTITSGGTGITVTYTSSEVFTTIQIYKNSALIINDEFLPAGVGLTNPYSLSWTSLDIIEIRLLSDNVS